MKRIYTKDFEANKSDICYNSWDRFEFLTARGPKTNYIVGNNGYPLRSVASGWQVVSLFYVIMCLSW